MATKKKYKRMTNAEKKMNKEVKSELRQEGLLPPIKKRLNRKKFIDEVKELLDSDDMNYDMKVIYIMRAIHYMLPNTEFERSITREHVGTAKVVKIAFEMYNFDSEIRARGENTYRPMDLIDRLRPILDL